LAGQDDSLDFSGLQRVFPGTVMDQNLSALWAQACDQLRSSLSKDIYARWIAVIRPAALDGDVLSLAVANDFYQCWLEENYLPLIRAAIAGASGRRMEIRLVVDSSLPALETPGEAGPSAPRGAPRASAKAPVENVLNPNLTFETFVVGPSNNFAHAAALAVAQSPAKAYNPLLIYGGVGLGKTHLMQAIGASVQKTSRAARVAFLSSEAFVNEYIDALREQKLVLFRRKYRHTDVLLIDDIQFLAGKERMQEEFFHTFNALYDSHKQIVLTCDRPASEVPGLTPRLVSRFEWGLVTELESPDLETRIAILRKKQQLLALDLPDVAVTFIAEHIRSNIRRLEGALIRVAAYAALHRQPLTVERLESLLRDTLDHPLSESVNIDAIQRAVAEHFDLRLADMTSKRRPQAVALPRQVAMYLCRTLTPHSLPTIGDAFGRNHATVIHACRHVTERMRSDGALRQSVAAVRHKLGAD
jgi:chromosomal replication initiator protein